MPERATEFRRRRGLKQWENQQRETQPSIGHGGGFGDSLRRSGAYAKPDAAISEGRYGQHIQAANLHAPGQAVGGAAIEPAAGNPDLHPVVGCQGEAGLEGAQGQIALARSGRPLDQDARPAAAQAKGDGGGVQGRLGGAHWRGSGRAIAHALS